MARDILRQTKSLFIMQTVAIVKTQEDAARKVKR